MTGSTISRILNLLVLGTLFLGSWVQGQVKTESGFRGALTAVAKAEPNAPEGNVPNRSSIINLQGIIPLSGRCWVPGNATLLGTGNGALLVYLGKDNPLRFYSAVGNGACQNIRIENVSIWAPFAQYGWDFDVNCQPGDFIFKDMRITTAGSHLNCNIPGGDHRFYWPKFENIHCFGTGNLVEGTVVGGVFDRCFFVNRWCPQFVIDLTASDAEFRKCWIEPVNGPNGELCPGILRHRGNFCDINWNSVSEMNGTPSGPTWELDGVFNKLVTSSLDFVSPKQYVNLLNGASVEFKVNRPTCSTADGWNVDLNDPIMDTINPITGRKDYLEFGLNVIRQSFVFDSKSYLSFGGGKVDAKGVTTATTKPILVEH